MVNRATGFMRSLMPLRPRAYKVVLPVIFRQKVWPLGIAPALVLRARSVINLAKLILYQLGFLFVCQAAYWYDYHWMTFSSFLRVVLSGWKPTTVRSLSNLSGI
jgi:hypothetical protein